MRANRTYSFTTDCHGVVTLVAAEGEYSETIVWSGMDGIDSIASLADVRLDQFITREQRRHMAVDWVDWGNSKAWTITSTAHGKGYREGYEEGTKDRQHAVSALVRREGELLKLQNDVKRLTDELRETREKHTDTLKTLTKYAEYLSDARADIERMKKGMRKLVDDFGAARAKAMYP